MSLSRYPSPTTSVDYYISKNRLLQQSRDSKLQEHLASLKQSMDAIEKIVKDRLSEAIHDGTLTAPYRLPLEDTDVKHGHISSKRAKYERELENRFEHYARFGPTLLPPRPPIEEHDDTDSLPSLRGRHRTNIRRLDDMADRNLIQVKNGEPTLRPAIKLTRRRSTYWYFELRLNYNWKGRINGDVYRSIVHCTPKYKVYIYLGEIRYPVKDSNSKLFRLPGLLRHFREQEEVPLSLEMLPQLLDTVLEHHLGCGFGEKNGRYWSVDCVAAVPIWETICQQLVPHKFEETRKILLEKHTLNPSSSEEPSLTEISLATMGKELGLRSLEPDVSVLPDKTPRLFSSVAHSLGLCA